MDAELLPILLLFIFVLSAFLGLELIQRVPSQLHTPLMSGSNAISGITIVGALIAAGSVDGGLGKWLGFAALVLATSTWSAATWSPIGCSKCSRRRTSKKGLTDFSP